MVPNWCRLSAHLSIAMVTMIRLSSLLALCCVGGALGFVGNAAQDEKIKGVMEKVNVSAPGVVREEGSLTRTKDEFQPEWLMANGNVSAFGKLRTLKTILKHLPVDGTPLLCGFLETFKTPTKLETLEEVAAEKTVAVAATLSMAAARHYKVAIPTYALFTNHSGVLDLAVYPGDLDSAGDVEDWIGAEKRRPRPEARPDPTCDEGAEGCEPVAATDPAAAASASSGEL